MLNNVSNTSSGLTATADGGHAVSTELDLMENLSSGSIADVFSSKQALLAGNRISILVGEEYIRTTLVIENIISRDPFKYDTSTITNGAIPEKVYLTGELRVEVKDISIAMEFQNISAAEDADILKVNKNVLVEDTVLLVLENNEIHELEHNGISFSSLPRVRYIRDYLNGSTANTGDHWVEIQAYERGTGTNRAASSVGATISGSVAENTSYPYSRTIDGSTNTLTYSTTTVSGLQYLQIDMGAEYDIENLKVWHYFSDGRTYYATKTQVSLDGVEWFTMYDSAVSGTYQETSAGKLIPVVDGPGLINGDTIDTSLMTKGKIPSRAYIPKVGLSFGDIVPKEKKTKYLLEDYVGTFNTVDIITEDIEWVSPISGKFYIVMGGGGGGGASFDHGTTLTYLYPNGGNSGDFAGGFVDLIEGRTYTITVGTGGLGGYSSFSNKIYVAGEDGTQTSFSDLIVAEGGLGGLASEYGSTINLPGNFTDTSGVYTGVGAVNVSTAQNANWYGGSGGDTDVPPVGYSAGGGGCSNIYHTSGSASGSVGGKGFVAIGVSPQEVLDSLFVLFTKERFNIIADTINARVDFNYSGDKMTSLKYNASRMYNRLRVGSEASIHSGSTVNLYQTIHYPMQSAPSGGVIGQILYADKVVLMDDGHYWGVGENTVEYYADGAAGVQAIITAEFSENYELAEWNDYVLLSSISPLEAVGMTATSIEAMLYNGAGFTGDLSYFKYDGSGTNVASKTFPSGTTYLGRWGGRRLPLVRNKNIGEIG